MVIRSPVTSWTARDSLVPAAAGSPLPPNGDVMRSRDSSYDNDDLWSVASSSGDLLIAGVNYDDNNYNNYENDDTDSLMAAAVTDSDERWREDEVPAQPSTTTTATTTTTRTKAKPAKTRSIRSVVRRNERERNRVRQVNQGFDRLRQYVRLPGLVKKKLSKVDTLRAACAYIKQLVTLLAQTEPGVTSPHATEQLLQPQSTQQLPQHDDVTGASSSIVFQSLLLTGSVNNSTPAGLSSDVTVSACALPPAASTPHPVLSYSTEGGVCLPLPDVSGNNNYLLEDEPCPPWSPLAEFSSDQQQRLSELTAWLME